MMSGGTARQLNRALDSKRWSAFWSESGPTFPERALARRPREEDPRRRLRERDGRCVRQGPRREVGRAPDQLEIEARQRPFRAAVEDRAARAGVREVDAGQPPDAGG